MGARAVDWARLESVCTARYRGFESLPIRHIFRLFASRPKAEHRADTELIGLVSSACRILSGVSFAWGDTSKGPAEKGVKLGSPARQRP